MQKISDLKTKQKKSNIIECTKKQLITLIFNKENNVTIKMGKVKTNKDNKHQNHSLIA